MLLTIGCGSSSTDATQGVKSDGARIGGAAASTPAPAAACSKAMPTLKAECPGAGGYLDLGKCEASDLPKVAMLDDATVRLLGPGTFLNLAGGPEWFLRADGALLANNGTAMGFCKTMPNVMDVAAAQARVSAPKRGDSPKTYEGVFDKDGNFLFEDCSQYELDVGSAIREELFRDPDEDEAKAMKRGAKRVGLRVEVARDVYMKTASQCLLAMNAG